MKLKRYIAALLSISVVLGSSACGNDSGASSNKKDSDDFSATENVEVADKETIAAIPDGAEKEIVYLGENDLNPTKSNPEKSTELQLFESKGGSIKFQQTSNEDRFDNLAAAITANKDVPDIFKYEWLSFPAQVVKDMYQPIDSIVDFDTPMWSGAKSTANQFMLDGKHYVAPLGNSASAMLCYDNSIIDAEGLDNPYELYLNGEWTWYAWENIMSEYVKNAPADTERYGVNGFFRAHIIQQTGKKFVDFDSEKNEFINNLADPDIEKGEIFLYDLMKDGLVLNGWIGSAGECFKQNCLFYAMGDWAYTGNLGPSAEDDWGVVPIPAFDDNVQKITTSDMTAFMWVRGTNKADAVKCWFECSRAAKTDEQYVQTNKDKFMENNPYWTDEMYNVKMDVVSDDYLMFFDYAYGVSSALGDRNHFDGNQCLVDALYSESSTVDDEGNQPTWTQVREKYTSTVESELKELNEKIKEIS